MKRRAAPLILILFLLLTSSVFAGEDLRRTEPGPGAAPAYEAFRSGSRTEGCDRILSVLRDGSRDPWAYRLGALCAHQLDGYETPFLEILAQGGEPDPLILWGRAYLAQREGDLASAETALRRALALEPEIPLAWSLLGVVLEGQERYLEATEAFEQAVVLTPELHFAREGLVRVVLARLSGRVGGLREFRDLLLRDEVLISEGMVESDTASPSGRTAAPPEAVADLRATGRGIDTLRERLGEAEAWLVQGRLFLRLDWNDAAQGALARSIRQARAVGKPITQGHASFHAALDLRKRGRHREAARLLRRSSQAYGEEDFDNAILWKGYADLRLGESLLVLGRPEAGLDAARSARGAFSRVKADLGLAESWNLAGVALLRLGRPPEALGAFQASRSSYEAAGLVPGEAFARHQEGVAHFHSGDPEGAARAYRQAGQIREGLGDHLNAGKSYYSAGSALSRLEPHGGATAEAFRHSLRAFRAAGHAARAAGDRAAIARARFREGTALLQLRRWDAALEALQEARSVVPEGEGHRQRAEAWFQEGFVHLEREDHPAALVAFGAAAELYGAVGDPVQQGDALRQRSKLQLDLGKAAAALADVREARRLYERAGAGVQASGTWKLEQQILVSREMEEGEVFDRLAGLLSALAAGWSGMEGPRVPRSAELMEILSRIGSGDPEGARRQGLERMTRLMALEPREKERVVTRWLAAGELTEEQLWAPVLLVGQAIGSRPVEAALVLESWLHLAETVRRRDLLLQGVAHALELLGSQGDRQRALRLARPWVGIAEATDRFHQIRAYLLLIHTRLLRDAGEVDRAVAGYERLVSLYRSIRDRRSEAGALLGKARTLFRYDRLLDAQPAYEEARELLARLGHRTSWAEAMLEEGQVVARLGHHDQALTLIRRARAEAPGGDLETRAHSWVAQAQVLIRAGRPGSALPALRTARGHYLEAGLVDRVPETWLGEGLLLLKKGDRGAVSALRQARDAYLATGLTLPQLQGILSNEALSMSDLGMEEEALDLIRASEELLRADGTDGLRVEAIRSMGEAIVLRALRRYPEAIGAFVEAKDHFRDLGSLAGQGEAVFHLADLYHFRGRNEEASTAFREARELFRRGEQLSGVGQTWLGTARVRQRTGDLPGALEAFRRARQVLERAGDELGLADAVTEESYTLFVGGRQEEALSRLRTARRTYQHRNALPRLADSWNLEARFLKVMGRPEEAFEAFVEAQRVAAMAGYAEGEAQSILGQARISLILGDHETALAMSRRARELYGELGDQLGLGQALQLQGQTWTQVGFPTAALAKIRDARRFLHRMGDYMGRGNAFLNEGTILMHLERYEAALRAFRSSREVFAAAGDSMGIALARDGEGRTLTALGRYPEALAAYRAVGEIHRQHGGGEYLLSANLANQAFLLLEQDDPTGALEAALEACRLLSGSTIGPRSFQSAPFLSAARAHHRLGNPEEAVAFARQAVDLHRQWRERFITDSRRTVADQGAAAAFDVLVTASADLGRSQSALSWAEKARSRVLLDLLGATEGYQGAGTGPATEEEEQLIRQLATFDLELRRSRSPRDRQQILELRNRLVEELDRLEYQRLASLSRSLPASEPLDARGLQGLAEETGPVLVFYSAEGELILFVVTADRPLEMARLEIGREELKHRVRELVHDLANPLFQHRSDDHARALWVDLLEPVVDHLPAGGPLTLIPHGPLHELPFAALLDGEGRRMFSRWDLSVVPSGSALAFAREGAGSSPDGGAFRAFFSDHGLPFTEAEAARIASFFDVGPDGPSRAEVTFSEYRESARRFRQLFFATRGGFEAKDRRGMYLTIEPTPGVHDSRLTAAEIASIPLVAELVVLAACDTTRGEALLSDERLDLTRAFLIAGASAALATRWKVPESPATTRFLVDFYRAYRTGGADGGPTRKDRALTAARQAAVDRGEPASLWAAWVLVGDAD